MGQKQPKLKISSPLGVTDISDAGLGYVPDQKSNLRSSCAVSRTNAEKEKCEGRLFEVHNVIPSKVKLKPGSMPAEIIFERCGSVVPEAYSELKFTPFEHAGSHKPVCNAFIAAVHTAFSSHYPLVFSPDSIWLCIMQGLALHINTHHEKLRHHFVEFEDKKTISVYPRVPFIKGSPDNPWLEIFDLFSKGIQGHIGQKNHELLTPSFSTTGPVERAASQIVLMDCFKQYFNYQMICVCGIPSITLQGTVDDWRSIRERALSLKQYELDWWIKELLPVLDQFVAAASGQVDKEFWISIYKLERSYGAELINGWILTLFPYFEIGKRNDSLDSWKLDTFTEKPNTKNQFADFGSSTPSYSSVTTSSLASGVVSVPFEWVSVPDRKTYPMQFFGGFMAATQDPDTLAIHPEIGWAVADREEIDIANKNHKSDMW